MKSYSSDKIRNVAIVGHSGSGKTMLVEHLLYTANAIERIGNTEAGNTQSDYDPIEIKHKISINSSIFPIEWHDHKINLIDVPGYPDFIGELHSAAQVVESMIIVCEAKKDLDVGVDLALEIAQKYQLACCIFINKLERDNADYEGLIDTLHQKLGRKVVSAQIPLGKHSAFNGIIDLLTMKVYKGKDRGTEIESVPAEYISQAAERREKMMDAAAEGDDQLAMKYLEGTELTEEDIDHGLHLGIDRGRVIPILLGSAHTGIGITTLLDRIVSELPSPLEISKIIDGKEVKTDPQSPLSCLVFKTTTDPYVGKINYLRIFGGTLKMDATIYNATKGFEEKIHHLFYPKGKNQEPTSQVVAGDICAVAKLQHTNTNDTLTSPKEKYVIPPIQFPEPIYRIAVKPVSKTDEDKLGSSIEKLLQEDPTLRFVRDPSLQQEILETMGDIHLECTLEKLKQRLGVNLITEDAKIPYRETITTSAKAQGKFKRQSGGHGQYGDCWLEVEPLPRGQGFQFENKVVGGAIPKNYIPAIEKGVREALEKGIVAGNTVQDVKVTVYDGSHHEVDSSEMAFKIAGALAFKAATQKASPVILEPILNVQVEAPDEYLGDIMGDLNSRRGRIQGMDSMNSGKTTINVNVPMATMTHYALSLRSITKGRGLFKQTMAHYDELPTPEAQSLINTYEKTKETHEEG